MAKEELRQKGQESNVNVEQVHALGGHQKTTEYVAGVLDGTRDYGTTIQGLSPNIVEAVNSRLIAECVDKLSRGKKLNVKLPLHLEKQVHTLAVSIGSKNSDTEQSKNTSEEGTEPLFESEGVQNFEQYQDLPNVRVCKERLLDILGRNGGDIPEKVQSAIYDMLTRRSEFVEAVSKDGGDLVTFMERCKPQKEWYNETMTAVEQIIDASGEMEWKSNPAWCGIHTRPEAPKKEGVNNKKVYATIPTAEYTFVQYLPDLAKALRELSIDSDDIIQVKVPGTFTGFMANNDSIVVHFKNGENAEKILEILNTWMQTNTIHEAPREMNRTKVAADTKDSSFSKLVAGNAAEWLQQHIGEYDNTELARRAIELAITQSQQPPIEK